MKTPKNYKNRKEQEKNLTSREKKELRKKRKEGLDSYYTVIQNTRTNYTKLVDTQTAFKYVFGVFDPINKTLVKTVKDTWIEVGFKKDTKE